MTQNHPIQFDRIMMITPVTVHRHPYFADAAYAKEAVDCLYRTQEMYPFFLYGFVVMPDHMHFLMRTIEPMRVSQVIGSYKSGLTFDLGEPKLWQARFHMRLPKDPQAALDYIHCNPVRAGLSSTIEGYRWSSGSGIWDVSPLDA